MSVVINGVEYAPVFRPKADASLGTLGAALRTIRKSHRMSLDEASKRIGCTKSHLWNLEKDGSEPGLRLAHRISDVYGVPLLVLALCATVEAAAMSSSAKGAEG